MTSQKNRDAGVDTSPIPLLESIRNKGRVWSDLCKQYDVDNPDPPWKINLEGMCDALEGRSCALPGLERREEEDELVSKLYADIPFPERQLLALVHSMISRNLVSEEDLRKRFKEVDKRLNNV